MPRKGFFLLALICGLIAAGSTYIYLTKTKQQTPPLSTKPLVVAKSDISARSVIKAEQLTLKDVPVQGYPQGGISSIQNATGTVALINLKAGDVILNTMLERPAADSSSSAAVSGGSAGLAVPEEKRAVAIPISLVSGVGYSVKPGDYVDILVTMDIKDNTGNQQTYTTLAAQDVLVLNTGGESVGTEKNKVESKSYTLALTVPQAMAVTLGTEKGSIRLLLRNPANKEQRTDQPFTANQFIDSGYFNRIK